MTEEMLIGEGEVLRYIVNSLNRLETNMSNLTDSVDAALAQLSFDTASAAAELAASQAATVAVQAALDTSVASTAIVQAALDAASAGLAVDETELQKALDGLNAANAALAALGQPVVPAPVDPAPVPVPDPAPVDPAPAPDPFMSAPTWLSSMVATTMVTVRSGEQPSGGCCTSMRARRWRHWRLKLLTTRLSVR